MSTQFDPSLVPAVARRDGEIVMTMSARQAKLLAASLWLVDIGDADRSAWLDAVAESLSDAASLHGAKMRFSAHAAAGLTQMLQDDTAIDAEAATSVEAAAVLATVVAERAVFAAADRAKTAASAAQQACATATARIASAVAESVTRQALAVQEHANAEAREVAAAAAKAAVRVASAVPPGHEVEARRAAVLVAQIATEAAAATAEETALVAAAAARAAAAAALEAAAEAADAAMWIELEVQSTARSVQDTADAAAVLVAGEVRKAAELALVDL